TLSEAMEAWKTNLIADLQKLGIILGKTQLFANVQIKEYKYKQDVTLHYFDLAPAPDCFGGCYTILNDEYLVFGTCCEPVIKIIDILKK
ncbi:hypothetical protein J7L09_00095, partial [bacterium]|nr:hypothetical protein [bacterium]